MASRAKLAILSLGLALLAGCGSPALVAAPASPPTPYPGPLFLTTDQTRSETDRQTGAAGQVVQCRTQILGHVDKTTQRHAGAPAGSPQRALKVGLSEGLYHPVPDDLVKERAEPERVLYVYRVAGSVKQAVIVHRGPTLDRGGEVGWYVESWARCNYAEFPDGMPVAGDLAVQVWTDAAGERQPTYVVMSRLGPDHCDWTSMTFLHVGDDEAAYVRNPQPDLKDDYFDEDYQTGIALPPDAVDTGYRRKGARLWLSPDKKRAYVGPSFTKVELWPRTTQPLLCA